MRILLVSKRFDFGGTENHVCDLANSLSELGHNVFLLANKGRQNSRLNPNITFLSIKLSELLFPVNALYIYYIIKKHNIEVIHAHHRTAILYSAIIRKLVKTPLIATVHGRTSLDIRSKFSRKAIDRVIFVSHYIFRYSKCYEQIKDKSVVIPNGIDVLSFNNSVVPNIITYVSRLDCKHSTVILMIIQEVLPRLLVEIPLLTFNVVGEGRGLKILKSEAEKLNLRMNRRVCDILGYQPEVKRIIQKSSLVLGVGRVSLEALACGVPVLSINQKRLGSIVSIANYDDYKVNNFVAIGSNAPTARAVHSIVKDFFDNQKRWHDETKIIQGFIKRDFNIQTLTKRVIDTYTEVIN